MMAWNARADPLATPAIPRLIDPPEACFVLEHQTNIASKNMGIQFLDAGVNFFEASMTSGEAFFG